MEDTIKTVMRGNAVMNFIVSSFSISLSSMLFLRSSHSIDFGDDEEEGLVAASASFH